MGEKPSANEILSTMSAYGLDVFRIEATIAEAKKELERKYDALSALLTSAMSETNAATEFSKGDIISDPHKRGDFDLYIVLDVRLAIKNDFAHSWEWHAVTEALRDGDVEQAASVALRKVLTTRIVKKSGALGLREKPRWRSSIVVGRVHEDLIPSLDGTFVLSGRDKVEFLSERARQKLDWKE